MTGMEALGAALGADFEVLRRLGDGSMATAYLARERALRRLVTIKVPRGEVAGDPLVRQRFEREARAAARIRHPAVAAIHRIGSLPDGTPYLVFEYVDGRTLDDVLEAEGPFEVPMALRLLVQLADALAAAHADGVVHRDVRPNNVFWVAGTQRAVLADFGLAGILESGAEIVTRLTQPGQPLGDPSYRSPEQLLGEMLTPAADVYGFGLVAFEALTGASPFAGLGAAGHAAAQLRQLPRELSETLPHAPPALAELIRRCLARDPQHRPTAAGLAQALRRIDVEGAAAAVDSAGPVERAVAGMPALVEFFAELKRRRVYNVAFGYAALCFVLLQGGQLILPALPLPGWSYTLLVAGTLAGFPVALVLAWMYDVTAGGVRRTASPQPVGSRYAHWLLQAAGLLLSLAAAALIGWWVLGSR